MFDIGFSELLVVSVVGLIILGPERLPMAAKTAGLWIRKIRRSIQSVQREINSQLDQEEMQRSIKETNERIMRESANFEREMHTTKPSPKPQADPEPQAESVSTSQDTQTDTAQATANKAPDETQSRA
ncbi:Sec-independent protein translocase protein TatB [Marinomonas gallaica]|uniref:Sec-independent protein translocase protein TatB n=1 Tax=Marinomonas gallaica TaxID=1806667 RepID=UPI003CE4B199